jgi:hypothetical protein
MADLGYRDGKGAIDPLTGFWTVTLDPSTLSLPDDFLIYRMYVEGPVGSMVVVYVDGVKTSGTPNGWLNEWDPNQPIYVRRGQQIQAKWNSNVTPATLFRIWAKEIPDNY